MKPLVSRLSAIEAIPCSPLAGCLLAAGDEDGSPLAGLVVAVLSGRNADDLDRHPSRAHLVVEVAEGLEEGEAAARAAVYARAGVAVCWVVNLAGRRVEWFRMPDRLGRRYRQSAVARGSDRLPLDTCPEAWIEAREVLLEGTGR